MMMDNPVMTSTPPVSRNRLMQESPPGSAFKFSHYFFFNHSIGFFVVLVDEGQLFRCAGQDFMCIAWFAVFGSILTPKPKLKPKPVPKPKAAPKPGPKGQHRQVFRMVYHRKKGFTSEPVEH